MTDYQDSEEGNDDSIFYKLADSVEVPNYDYLLTTMLCFDDQELEIYGAHSFKRRKFLQVRFT